MTEVVVFICALVSIVTGLSIIAYVLIQVANRVYERENSLPFEDEELPHGDDASGIALSGSHANHREGTISDGEGLCPPTPLGSSPSVPIGQCLEVWWHGEWFPCQKVAGHKGDHGPHEEVA